MKMKRRDFLGTAVGLFGALYVPRVDVSAGITPVRTEAEKGFWGVHSYSCTTHRSAGHWAEKGSDATTEHDFDVATLEFDCTLYAEESGRVAEYKLDFLCSEKEWVRTKKFKPKKRKGFAKKFKSNDVKLLSEQMGRDWTMGAHGYANALENIQMPPYYTSSDLEFWKSGTKDTAPISEIIKSNDMFKDLYDIVVRFSSPDHPNFKKGIAKDHENVMRLNKCYLTGWKKKIYPPEVKREKG
jgi:hypothetical protein